MKFAVFSDIHDNIINLNKAIQLCIQNHISEVVICGDFCSPFVLDTLGASKLNFHCVFGNNDGDKFTMANKAAGFSNIKLYGEYIGDETNPLLLNNLRIAATHYPFYAKALAKTGWYDCVFYGHNHIKVKQKFGACLLLNPGEICGVLNPPSFAIIHTVNQHSEFLDL